jgi:hypothetical protein
MKRSTTIQLPADYLQYGGIPAELSKASLSQENHSADPWIHAQNKCCFKLLEGKVVYYARKAN